MLRWSVLFLALSPAWVWGEPITFSGAEVFSGDPVILKGEFQPPSSAHKPLLLLFHGLGSTAQEWGPLVRLAEKRGWGTLAFDARGHGQSLRTLKGAEIHYDDGRMTSSLGRGMVEDAGKVMEALSRDPKKNKCPLVLVGASVGANVALRASQGRTEVRCLVLLSPGLNYAGVTTEDLAQMISDPVLMVAAQPDTYAFHSVITLERLRPDWTSWRLPQGTPQGAHGVQLFTLSLEEDILNWIQEEIRK